ncbi:MAG: histone deacetylase family protein, partial [Burkholderiales bacterium]|nr:histone deacetylase family protein [Burkholderiales bacterium]
MLAYYSPRHLLHRDQSEFIGGQLRPGFELPVRAERVRQAYLDAALGNCIEPPDQGLEPVLAVHDAAYVDFLAGAWSEWAALGHRHPALPMIWHAGAGLPRIVPRHIEGRLGFYSIDAGCAIVEGTWPAVYWSAQCAIAGADALGEGRRSAFAICRPPGHHAAAALMGGYCYLNNAAIAAERLRRRGFARVAILDVDYHHGNGTQSIFWRRGDVFFASLHADPHDDYPYFSGHADECGEGPGLGQTLNLPLPAGTTGAAYLAAFDRAIDAIAAGGCDALVVSLGVDTFDGDPISKFRLHHADYLEMGRRMRRLGLPALFVFEGG